jgi:hypothetical protein
MNRGVRILLARMESHPEEFDYYTDRKKLVMSRWDWAIQAICRRVENQHKANSAYVLDVPFLTDEEVNSLHEKFMSIQGDAFTKKIMSELLEEDSLPKQGELFMLTTHSRFA